MRELTERERGLLEACDPVTFRKLVEEQHRESMEVVDSRLDELGGSLDEETVSAANEALSRCFEEQTAELAALEVRDNSPELLAILVRHDLRLRDVALEAVRAARSPATPDNADPIIGG